MLPKLELKPGYTGCFIGGRGHDDILQLLWDLHAGVMEIAPRHVGSKPLKLDLRTLSVLACDGYDRSPPTLGFVLRTTGDEEERNWEFFITIADYRRTAEKLPPTIRETITTVIGRVRLGRLLQAGLDPPTIEARLTSPEVKFLQAKLTRLRAEIESVKVAAFREAGTRPGFLQPDPATKRFFLEQKEAALAELLAELERGEHLLG